MATIRQDKTQENTNPKLDPAAGSARLHDQFELVLNWYKINNRSLFGEEVISNLHIQKLMEILGNPIWNQIYHCWQVELKHMPELQPYVEHQFDSTKFVYFIEAYNNNRP